MQDTNTVIPLNEIVLLPGSYTLQRLTNDQLNKLDDMEIYPYSKRVIGGNRWLVAIRKKRDPYTDLSGKKTSECCQIYRARILDNGSIKQLPDIILSSHFLNHTLAIKDDVIYMGGHQVVKQEKGRKVNTGEMAGFMDLTLDEPVWNPLPLPIEMKAGKSIDDVLVCDNKLVLVDNIMYPKYLFEYDISNPLVPVPTKTIDLPNNGTYEHIDNGSIDKNWMAIKSGGVGRSGTSQYISVFSLPEYEQFFTVQLSYSPVGLFSDTSFTTLAEELEKARDWVTIHDYAVAGDNLVIACGFHGLVVFPLQELYDSYLESERRRADPDPEVEAMWKFRSCGSIYYLNQVPKHHTYKLQVDDLGHARSITPLAGGKIIVGGEAEKTMDHQTRVIQL